MRACGIARSTGDETPLRDLLANLDGGSIDDARLEADNQIARAERLGISVVCYLDDCFPERLRTTDDPPAVLWIKGHDESLHATDAVAVIGTREPSSYATKTAKSAAKYLASKGAVIVSGLAKGCDTLAHEGCLEAGGRTVAVLAHGLDKVYPAENRSLAEQIVDKGGALVSEYPVGMPAQRNFFVERDRLQSGLSDSVLVVETSESGGSMHTARFAEKQGRTLATMEHPAHYRSDPRVAGNEEIKSHMGGLPVEGKEHLDALLLSYRFIIAIEAKYGSHPIKQFTATHHGNDHVSGIKWMSAIRNSLAHPNAQIFISHAAHDAEIVSRFGEYIEALNIELKLVPEQKVHQEELFKE